MFKTLFKRHSSGLIVCSNGYVYVPVSNHKYEPHWTSGYKRPDGYCVVRLNGKGYFVHRLVAECFLENPNNEKYVDHINRCRWCNEVDNLRFCSCKENAANTTTVDRGLEKYGVRCCEDKKAYWHAWYSANRENVLSKRKNAQAKGV